MKLCDTLDNIVKHNNRELRTFIVITVCNRLMNNFTVRIITEHLEINRTHRRDSGIKQCSSIVL